MVWTRWRRNVIDWTSLDRKDKRKPNIVIWDGGEGTSRLTKKRVICVLSGRKIYPRYPQESFSNDKTNEEFKKMVWTRRRGNVIDWTSQDRKDKTRPYSVAQADVPHAREKGENNLPAMLPHACRSYTTSIQQLFNNYSTSYTTTTQQLHIYGVSRVWKAANKQEKRIASFLFNAWCAKTHK